MALWDNLTHYWPLDENTGDTATRADAVGTADLDGDIATVAGKSDNAVESTDQSESLGTESGVFVDDTTVDTVSFWFKLNATQSRIDGGVSGFTFIEFLTWEVVLQNSKVQANAKLTVAKQSSVSLTANQWHLAVVQFNWAAAGSGAVFVSVDGGSFETTFSTGMHKPTIGGGLTGQSAVLHLCRDESSNAAFAAAVDEVALWNRGLSSVDVSELWNSGAGKFYPAPVNPAAASATWVVPAPDRIAPLELDAAVATWVVPDPAPDGVTADAAVATWVVPAPDRIGKLEPPPASATWAVPAPDRIGAAAPYPAAGLWVVESPEQIGQIPDAIRFASVTLKSGGLSSASLFQ